MRRPVWLIAALLLLGLWLWAGPRLSAPDAPSQPSPAVAPSAPEVAPAARRAPDFLPAQALPVLEAIARGGPHPYRQDGGVFQNRERLLPARPRGYYREYTVPTPGSDDRGPRRIVTGGDPPVEYWYTDDHYRSFRPFEPGAAP